MRGACVPKACTDECTAGTSNAGKTCALYDLAKGEWTDAQPATSTHDRARAYIAAIRKHHLPHGQLGSVRYSDPGTYSVVESLDGLGDSALHTGEYLASEALRLVDTGAVDARDHVKKGVDTLHLLFNVTGYPGVLARHAVPSDASDLAQLKYDCSGNDRSHHCNVPYGGTKYNYRGHVSRDMYQGPMLAYGIAYDALGPSEEDARDKIRKDVVTLVEELMKEKTAPLKLEYNGTKFPKVDVTMRFALLIPNELEDGAISLKSNGSEGSWRGFQEFIPDLGDVVKQIPLAGMIAPSSIPRSSSAVMLASFFRLALHVTEGVPAYASRRTAIEKFYLENKLSGGNVHDWMKIARAGEIGGDGEDGCGKRYFANNLVMQPLYNWARLEKDPAVKEVALQIVEDVAWPAFAPTKNPFFQFICQGLTRKPDKAAQKDAATQLAGFGPPPRVRKPVDLRSDPKYAERQPSCTDHVVHTTAVDVGDRISDEFIWQNDPWGLYFDGDLGMVNPGGDYLVAYWMGRRHGMIEDDRPGTCQRWK